MNGHATYNITDNRLKVWFDDRLPEDDYKRSRALKFAWWPGRKCFSAVWSPDREDWILSHGIEIEADDTPDDVESRVQRFQRYAKDDEESAEWAQERTRTANTRRQYEQAERTAAKKIDEARYWHDRIAGAIRHAAYKDRPDVIVRRIKKLEAAQRKQDKIKTESTLWLIRWRDKMPLKLKSGDYMSMQKSAEFLANYDPGHFSMCFTKDKYPNSDYEGSRSIWGALTDGVIDPEEARRLMVDYHSDRIGFTERWLNHLAMRVEYETAYLESVGGSADMLKPKPRRKSIAPDDGLKKGDTVLFGYGYYGNGKIKGEILRLYAKTVRVKFIDRPELNEKYPKGYKTPRLYLDKPEEVNA